MKAKLGDLCTICSSRRIMEKEYTIDGIPFVRGLEVTNKTLLKDDAKYECYISKERFDELKDKYGVPQIGDILITSVGTIGNLCYINKKKDFYFKDGNLIWFKQFKKGVYSKYLYYFMQSPYFKNQLNNLLIGAVQKALTMFMLSKIDIDLPEYSKQVEIADTLEKFDLKVENNSKIISELESTAKTLYDYWFLQFEFPNQEGKPYKSSGGKMVYSKELKREIPEEWKVINVKKHCKITWGQCPNGENILPLNTDQDSMLYCSGAGDMRNGLLIDCQARTNASRRIANANDILMSVAGSIGAICFCDKTISLGRAAVAFSPNKNEELFTLMSVMTFSDRMKTVSSGSIQKVVNDNHLDDMNLVLDDEVLTKFSKYNSLLNEMVNLCRENQELASLRNFLLPMLMNGQVTFK